jgi:hypothetical protein
MGPTETDVRDDEDAASLGGVIVSPRNADRRRQALAQRISLFDIARLGNVRSKHMLAILATTYRLNENNRVSSLYWTRGSKQCFLTCFSYFSCYFCILVFSRDRYLLISSRLSWLHGNPFSHPISRTIGTPS